MPPRKRAKSNPSATGQNLHREAQNGAHPTHLHAVQSQSEGVGYNGPLTRSRRLRTHPPPIHTLPPEVLGEIFILVLPTDQEIHTTLQFCGSSKRRILMNPLMFSAVCSSWRLLTCSIPQLWKRVLVHFPSDLTVTRAKNKATGLVQWISRSRSLPLTLHISSPKYVMYHDGTGPEAPIISVLNDYAARWEFLYFQQLRPYFRHLFPFDGWPVLRRLCFPSWHPVSPTSEIAWAQLTHLQIQWHMSCHGMEIIFMRCPKLVHLSIWVNPSLTGLASVPMTLYNLVTFSLRMRHASDLRKVVHQLSLPSLRELLISQLSREDIGPLLGLFTRSSCTLDKLDIQSWCLKSRHYVKIFSHWSCSSLSSLTIRPICHRNVAPLDDQMLQRLTLNMNKSLCIHLKFLTIDYCLPTSLLPALLNMVKSRIKSHSGQAPDLQYLQLHVQYLKDSMAELDQIGWTSENQLEYSRKTFQPGCRLVWFQRGGIGAPPNFGELFQS